jgi:hypothetical protein
MSDTDAPTQHRGEGDIKCLIGGIKDLSTSLDKEK